jgi:hypothetical protein
MPGLFIISNLGQKDSIRRANRIEFKTTIFKTRVEGTNGYPPDVEIRETWPSIEHILYSSDSNK